MKQLKIALTALAAESGISQENWKTVPLKGADLTDVSAVVMTSRDEIPAAYDTIHAFSIPLFILDTGEAASRNMSEISGTLLPIKEKSSWKKRITRAALQYEIECYAKTGQGWDKNLDSLCSILESELKTLDATFRFHTGGSLMKYTKKERMNIGRQIYEDQINKYEAAGKYGISAQTAREYMRMYRNTNHLPPKTSKPRDYGLAKAKVIPEAAKLDEYQKMSKEDLISALIDARIREERLKLGYEVVEEDDSKKKLITYVKKTAK